MEIKEMEIKGMEILGLLSKKKVLVTGGSRGIGLAVVKACLAGGAEVAATWNTSEDGLSDLKDGEFGDRLTTYRLDIRDAGAVKEVTADVVKRLDGVDALVNNAGISRSALFMMMSDEQWNEVFQTNLGGARNVTGQVLLPMLSKKKGNNIVIG
ncbi:MAG: SDR family NAD(P)-dependent oxidoreductase [Synergistaceae bacterium]|jgi:3-oxoacyl-[acyl-carrier protein] reductase|nr:SDR family NAD(P)-dependent oxidoreductase [Synergistaceae bacterium]